MKKILSLLLAMIMVFSLATVAFAAENQDAVYTKKYTATNADSVNPGETFTITYTNGVATDAATGDRLKKADGTEVEAPVIDDSTVTYAQGDLNAATAAKAVEKTITVALSEIDWPYVGIYTYDVTETAGTSAGVVYDTTARKLKVTVAYDEGTNTYYTAFVTLTLTDADGDGITDGDKTDVIENVYNAGKLSVSKTVTGNMGDQEKEFIMTVKFKAPAGKTVNAPITYTDSGETKSIATTAWVDGVATAEITLKHGETVTFNNIPYGVTYAVIENSYADAGYDAAQYVYGNTVDPDGSNTINFDPINMPYITNLDNKIDDAEDAVEVINNKSSNVDTGIALDSAPYFLMLAVAVIGMVALVSKKRYEV